MGRPSCRFTRLVALRTSPHPHRQPRRPHRRPSAPAWRTASHVRRLRQRRRPRAAGRAGQFPMTLMSTPTAMSSPPFWAMRPRCASCRPPRGCASCAAIGRGRHAGRHHHLDIGPGGAVGTAFASNNFHDDQGDSQGFMVQRSSGVAFTRNSTAPPVVAPGTTTELNLADYVRIHRMRMAPVLIEQVEEIRQASSTSAATPAPAVRPRSRPAMPARARPAHARPIRRGCAGAA